MRPTLFRTSLISICAMFALCSPSISQPEYGEWTRELEVLSVGEDGILRTAGTENRIILNGMKITDVDLANDILRGKTIVCEYRKPKGPYDGSYICYIRPGKPKVVGLLLARNGVAKVHCGRDDNAYVKC